jgi:hypothetical protein
VKSIITQKQAVVADFMAFLPLGMAFPEYPRRLSDGRKSEAIIEPGALAFQLKF